MSVRQGVYTKCTKTIKLSDIRSSYVCMPVCEGEGIMVNLRTECVCCHSQAKSQGNAGDIHELQPHMAQKQRDVLTTHLCIQPLLQNMYLILLLRLPVLRRYDDITQAGSKQQQTKSMYQRDWLHY